MSEKHLTEQPWKVLATKHQIKDVSFQKALISYAKVDASKEPEKATELLADLIEVAGKVKKANSAIKEVTSYLDDVVKEANKTKQAIAALPKPAPAKEETEEEEDEDDGADLKVRLMSSLKKVKAAAAAEEPAPIGFVACVAKPLYGILLAKSPTERVGATHRKTLTDLTGGTKFIVGNCLFENDSYTFIVDSVPSGLAKNLKKSLKEYTGLAYKVRVRDTEGKVVADGDTEVAEEEPQAAAAPGASPAAETPPASPPPDAGNAEAMGKFTGRLKGLQPEMLKVIASKSPQAEELKKKIAEAGAHATRKDFEKAHQELDAIEALLKKAAATPPPSAATAPKPVAAEPKPEPAVAPREIKLSTYLSGRSNLRAARENAAKELQRLQQVILAKAAGEPFYAEVEAKSQKLFEYLKLIDDSVMNKLDEAGKCPDPELQMELNKKVRELIQKQLIGIRTHPLAAFVEKNPFGKFAIKQPLEVTLAALDKQLS